MKRTLFFFVTSLLLISAANAQKDYTQWVNPFIGTGGHGHTYPGASMPFGMMQLSADTRMADWDGSSGYHYSDSVIYGFSHTHLSGTGIPDYCDVLLMPFTGNVQWENKDYRSRFSHKNEKASPGYYEVLLDKNKIKAQLTTTTRAGMHQYSFPATAKEGSILIDLVHRDKLLDAKIEVVNPYEIRGYRVSRSWALRQTVYFHIRFDQPIVADSSFWGTVDSGVARSTIVKKALRFQLPSNKMLRCRVGISGVSMEGAKLNLKTEIKDWNFDRIRNEAKSAWNRELSKIDVQGGTKNEQTVFYTALYHTFLVPNIYQDVDGHYRGTDLKIHKAEGFTNYSVFSLWDTYRAYHPLMTIINQKRTADWVNTFLKQYQYGGMLPVWELSGNETFCMIGYHSVPVITDAYQKGIRGFDAALALKAMTSYAESDRFGLKFYREQGYIGNDQEHESVSKTLEYAYDDWCIAQMAKMLGKKDIYETYLQRAQNYMNLFDPQTHNMRGKVQAMWHRPFDPKEINNFFTEGNSWQYSFAVPQDIEKLIYLHGGKEAFTAKLEELFTTSSKTTGRDQADVTGLIGQYAQGNEPSHHMAYLFNYVNKGWRTQELVQKICREFYRNDPDGLIGNEDCGQMSAWYIMSALGLYAVTPGDGNYVLGIPVFDEASIQLENGQSVTIRAKGRSKGVNYVKSVQFNGTMLDKSYVAHADLMKGGVLDFTLQTQKPSTVLAAPPSSIQGPFIRPVPYFDVPTNQIRDSLLVTIKEVDPRPDQTLWYGIAEMAKQGMGKMQVYQYTGPFFIHRSSRISAYITGRGSSKTVIQDFVKVPSDKNITILSKVNPMYTAGGSGSLIDSIFGNANWRTGNWQGYYDQDFEAVVDLLQSRPITYAGIHVLEDASPWILYPKTLIISASDDGRNYREIARVQNDHAPKLEAAQVKQMGANVNLTTRYIKVKAIGGGPLPGWHESAGSPSHLFIDEVIVQ